MLIRRSEVMNAHIEVRLTMVAWGGILFRSHDGIVAHCSMSIKSKNLFSLQNDIRTSCSFRHS